MKTMVIMSGVLLTAIIVTSIALVIVLIAEFVI